MFKKFFELANKKKRFMRYAVGGIFNFSLIYIITIVLTDGFHIHSNISYAIALVFSLVFLFYYNKRITFRIKHNNARIVCTYIITTAAVNMMSWISVALFSYVINYKIAIIIVSIMFSVVNYKFKKWWVFKK